MLWGICSFNFVVVKGSPGLTLIWGQSKYGSSSPPALPLLNQQFIIPSPKATIEWPPYSTLTVSGKIGNVSQWPSTLHTWLGAGPARCSSLSQPGHLPIKEMLFLSLFFGHNQINAKSKNAICSLHNGVAPRTFRVCFTSEDPYSCFRGWWEGGGIWEHREQTTLPSELPKSLPNFSVTHTFILSYVSSHQQDLHLTRKIQLFPPPLLFF